ncbi:CHAD domain-containing protein [Vibrio sp. zbq_2]|uniref:CHAD domain-containing protein n=1 Tax=Vibrio sp. zbq_2 TaxID=3367238 RepID=UPI00370AB5C8
MDNLHPEFTHQYRVTLRRMRSLCVLLSEVIPCFELAILKPHLKTLMIIARPRCVHFRHQPVSCDVARTAFIINAHFRGY